ncbi:MAG: DUF3450 domain-containing protein [Candidatus Pacearchaeota archaeon]|nr:DUF3450 domain-containing protein [Candidatus Pacearchaeota archaeon]
MYFVIFLVFFIFALSFVLAEVDWQAIEQKPSKLYDMKLLEAAFNEDSSKVVKIIDNNPALLQKESFKKYVVSKVDMLAQQDVLILNDNPNIKKEWFLSYGIKDEGGTLQEYDGKFVTLSFLDTKFDITDNRGSIVTYRDTLILPNKAEILGGLVLKDGERIILSDGTIDVTNCESIDILVIAKDKYGEIKNNDKTFLIEPKTEPSRSTVIKTKESFTVTGEDIVISDKLIINGEERYRPNSELSGKLTLTKTGIILAKATTYITYFLGLKDTRYQVDAETFIFPKEGDCEEITASCVEADTNNRVLRIIAKANKMNIETFPYSPYGALYIEPINDESEVIFIDRGVIRMTFGKEPFTIEGYLNKISIDVFYRYEYDGKPHEIQIKDGLLKYCSICETLGATKTIDLTKIQTLEIKLFDKSYSWAINAVYDPKYASLGGAKGKVVYADKYKTYEKEKTHHLETYKELLIKPREKELEEKINSKKLAEERIAKLQAQLSQETDEATRNRIMQDIQADQEYLKYLGKKISELEQQIDSIKGIEYAYDCIGFVQAAFIEGERALQKQPYNWYRETDGFKLIQELTNRYALNKALIVFGSSFNETHYIHGKTREIAPIPKEILATGTKVLYFESKKERDDFLRAIPPGSPFQNYNRDGTPHHSGIKGISEASLEAHIGDVGFLAEEDIQRYNDPLVFAFPEKKKITLDDIMRIAKK